MKRLILIALMLSSQAYAYYDPSADYSHGAQTYDEYVLGAPSRANDASLNSLAPTIIHFSDKIQKNGQTNMYEEGKSETRKVIFKENKMETK